MSVLTEPPGGGRLLLGRLDDDGRAVADHFRDALGDFRRVVANGDDGIRAESHGMLNHQLIRFLPRGFGQLRIERDVAANHALEAGADISKNGAASYRDPPN